MTVRDMHLELNISTQLVNAYAMRKWYPEEKDWVLNKMMERFIRSRLRTKKDGSGGFELDQANVDDIRTLLKTNVPLDAYIVDETRYKSWLPYDYAYLISDSSLVTNLCNGSIAETIDTKTLYRVVLNFPASSKGDPAYFETITAIIDDTSVVLPGNLPQANKYVGYREQDDIDFLGQYIALRGKWWWEKFDDLIITRYFIAVLDHTPSMALTTIDGGDNEDTGTVTLNLTVNTGVGKRTNNRLTPTNNLQAINQSAFFKTSYYSPISELANSNLYIYRDGSFTVNGTLIDYIRKPQPISLSLGTDCELPEGTHQSICDLAIEYIKSTTENAQGKQLKTDDISNRVVL